MFSAASESKRSQPVRINAMTDDDNRIYQVVVNDEEQYSIWFADRRATRRLADRGQGGSEGGVPVIYREGLDGHAPAQPQEADGRSMVTP